MGKELILAVAGSGKTTKILKSLDDTKRSLIVTYTNENRRSLESALIGKNVCLMSYFSFLYVFCIRPFCSYHLRDKSYTWNSPPYSRFGPAKTDIRYYISKGRYLYANRASKLLLEFEVLPKIISRLEKHFDVMFVDEVQDFAANDFNFLIALSQAKIDFLFVGDFFQHTFDTSRDGGTRKNLHKKGADPYTAEFVKAGFDLDGTSLAKTYRCSPTVCNFITEKLGIQIESHRDDSTIVSFVEDQEAVAALIDDDQTVKLFYQNSKRYDCHANNWGKSKGLNKYKDVCVVLNKETFKLFVKDKLSELNEQTRNKLYVACSRARGNLYFVEEAAINGWKH